MQLSANVNRLSSAMQRWLFVSILAIWLGGSPGVLVADPLLDDHLITIHSAADVANKRHALIQFIWGAGGFPNAKMPSLVSKGVQSPVQHLENLERVDRIDISMDANQTGLAYHFIPVRKINRLVVVHHGHVCSFDDSPAVTDDGYGMQRTINGLLLDGYSVLAVYMPHFNPFDCGQVSHTSMFSIATTGSPMKFFLEPMAVSLNYLQSKSAADKFPVYQDFSMTGLSGGGWTTTVYAAIDPRIKLSLPVAGTIPLYLRSGGSVGDTEQFLSSFYNIAGYPDLYVLGSYGAGRKQVQILNRRDRCCFGQTQHDPVATGMPYDVAMRSYELNVRDALAKLDNGYFRLEIDEASNSHQISHNAVVNTILAELNGGRRYIGAISSQDAFVRGRHCHLWHYGAGGWEDTGLKMVGIPSALRGAVNTFDIFYRDPANNLMHGYRTANGWHAEPMSGVVITDPAAASWAPGRFDVVAFGGDYKLYHWWWNGIGVSQEPVNNAMLGHGPPSLVAAGSNHLDIFFRGTDRAVYRMTSNGSAPWTQESVGGIIQDFPAAIVSQGSAPGRFRVYVLGESRQLWEASKSGNEPWSWASLSAVTGSVATALGGTPSASLYCPATTPVGACNQLRVHVRTSAGPLSTFTLTGNWSFSANGGNVSGSPTSTVGGALVRGGSGALWLYNGQQWISRGGRFD